MTTSKTRFRVLVNDPELHEALKPARAEISADRAVIAQIYLLVDPADTRVEIQGVLLPSSLEQQAIELFAEACNQDLAQEDAS